MIDHTWEHCEYCRELRRNMVLKHLGRNLLAEMRAEICPICLAWRNGYQFAQDHPEEWMNQ